MAHSWTSGDLETWKRLHFRAQEALKARRRRGEWTKQGLGDLKRAVRSAYRARFPAAPAEHGRLNAFLRLCEEIADAGGIDHLIAGLERGLSIVAGILGGASQPTPPVAAAASASRLPYRDE